MRLLAFIENSSMSAGGGAVRRAGLPAGRHLGGVLRHGGCRQWLAAEPARITGLSQSVQVVDSSVTCCAIVDPAPDWGGACIFALQSEGGGPCISQKQHAEMRQEREAAAARAEVAEGALQDERLRSSMAASKCQEQLHQCALTSSSYAPPWRRRHCQ